MSKTLEQKIQEYSDKTVDCGSERALSKQTLIEYCQQDFRAGFEDCEKEYEEKLRWIPIEEKLPENGDEIELQNNEWINDYNQKGIRTGYYDKCKNPVFYSCFWNTDEECYDTSTQKPTKWRSFL